MTIWVMGGAFDGTRAYNLRYLDGTTTSNSFPSTDSSIFTLTFTSGNTRTKTVTGTETIPSGRHVCVREIQTSTSQNEWVGGCLTYTIP
jgi:hypothetical protein